MIRDDLRGGLVAIVPDRLLNRRDTLELDALNALLDAGAGIIALPPLSGLEEEVVTIARDAVDYLARGYRVVLVADDDEPWTGELLAELARWDRAPERAHPGTPITADPGFRQASAPGAAGRGSATPLEIAVAETLRDAGPDAPVVLALHAYDGDERYFAPYVARVPERFTVIALRGPVASNEGRHAWFPAGEPGTPERTDADAALAALTGWIDANLPGRTIVPIGFSQGGAMAIMLLRARPGLVPGAATVAGFLVPGDRTGEDVLPTLRPPVLGVWDPEDPVVIPAAIARMAEWLEGNTALTRHLQHGGIHDVDDTAIDAIGAFLDGLPL